MKWSEEFVLHAKTFACVRACMWQSRSVLKNDLRITWAFQCPFFSDCLFIARLFNSPLLCFSKLFLFVSIFDIFQVCVLTIKKPLYSPGNGFQFSLGVFAAK